MHEGTHFSTLGVATDWSITDGLTFLTEFGPFDEIAVGKNWLNMGIQRYVMSELPGEAGLPQLVVTERDVDVGTGAITARHETVIDRRVGANAILLWAASLTPSSTPKVKKEGTVPVSQQSRNPGTSKDG